LGRVGESWAKFEPPKLKLQIDRRQEEIDKALESIKMLRKRTGRITVEELPSKR
jgi:hypothetical protein